MLSRRSEYSFEAKRAEAAKPLLHASEVQRRVIQFLRQNRGFRSFAEIKDGIHIDLVNRPDVIQSLKNNEKVKMESRDDGKKIRYRAKFDAVQSLEDLRIFMRQQEDGVSLSDLEDAYIGIEEDLEKLVAEKYLFKIDVQKPKANTVFFFRDSTFDIDIDNDIRELWRSVILPASDAQVDGELAMEGLHDSMHTRKAKRVTKQKAPKSRTITKQPRKYVVSNVHVADELVFLKEKGKLPKKLDSN